MNQDTELKNLLASRAYLYELFHKLLGGEPTLELLKAFSGRATNEALNEYAEAGESMTKLQAFAGDVASKLEDESTVQEYLSKAQGEYNRLFVGPNSLPAQPHETPYVSKEMTLFSENSLIVRRKYAAWGYEPKRVRHVPDDHVSLMLDYLSRLATRTAGAYETQDQGKLLELVQEQGSFIAEHMMNWIPELARLQRKTSTPVLYPQLTTALEEFIALDVVTLASIREYVAEELTFAAEDEIDSADGSNLTNLFESALADLHAIRLVGLEDCELTAIVAE